MEDVEEGSRLIEMSLHCDSSCELSLLFAKPNIEQNNILQFKPADKITNVTIHILFVYL